MAPTVAPGQGRGNGWTGPVPDGTQRPEVDRRLRRVSSLEKLPVNGGQRIAEGQAETLLEGIRRLHQVPFGRSQRSADAVTVLGEAGAEDGPQLGFGTGIEGQRPLQRIGRPGKHVRQHVSVQNARAAAAAV